MSEQIRVICTGGKDNAGNARHAAIPPESIVVDDDGGVRVMTTRKGRAPWSAGAPVRSDDADINDSVMPNYLVVSTSGRRDDFEDRPRWRFECGKCRRNVPLNEVSLAAIATKYLAAGLRVFDISRMP